MLFKNKHRPTNFSELVFAASQPEQALREYAAGKRHSPLIIYGPHGSGKSTAADMIRRTVALHTAHNQVSAPISARIEVDRKSWGDLVLTLSQGISPKGYMQIDDADVLSSDLIEELDEIIETPRFGTVIMTVKDLHIIPAWVQSRCEKIQLLFPNAQQFVRRAHAILHAEGLRITANDVESLLTGFDGNWWDFLRLLESHVIKSKP